VAELVDEDGVSEFIDASNVTASGVENRDIDFWANLRADGRFPACRCL
jgi:hypothetical protein